MNTRVYAICLVALLSLAACEEQTASTVAPEAAASPVEAESLHVTARELPVFYTTSGVVASDHRVAVSSRLSGYIREIAVREGQAIDKGDLLFRIDPVDARQAYEQARADLEDVEVDLRRYEGLLKEHAVSQQQFDKVRLRYKVARSRMLQARNQLKYAEVRSPVSGFVVEKLASAGNLATPGHPVVVVEDPSRLLIETHVSERVIGRLQIDDRVAVHVPALGRSVEGRIRQIVTAADPVSHQFLVKAAIRETDGIFPGMFVEARFHVGVRQGILVPRSAIVRRSGLAGLYVLDEQRVAHYRQVRLGEVQGERVEVLAGLEAGELVVWRRDGRLHTGQRVVGG